MSPQFRERLPVFELSIFLAVLIIGWAALQLYQIAPRVEHDRDNIEVMRQATNDVLGVFTNLQAVFTNAFKDRELSRKVEDLKLPEALRMQDEYLSLASVLQTNVNEVHALLAELMDSKERPVADRLQSRSLEMKTWLKKQQDRAKLERFGAKSLELKERINRAQLLSTNGPIRITQDLEMLLEEIDGAYERYLTEAGYIKTNYWKPGEKEKFHERWRQAESQAIGLLELASQARTSGRAIETFVESQSQSEFAKRKAREDEVLNWLQDSQSPSEFVRRAGRQAEPDDALKSGSISPPSQLRRVSYALMVALSGLGVFLMVAVYRRAVVLPLRVKLVQRDTMIEHQKKLAHLEEVAAGLAHEIRNPLTTINARLYTVQRKLQEGTPEHADTVVIANEIDRVNQILRNFIQLTRPAPPYMSPMTPEPLLKEVSDLMAPQFQPQAVRLKWQSQGETQFSGDYQQLKQVLINLVKNAAEAIGENGTVTLRSRTAKAPLQGVSTKVVVLEVEDTGPGMSPEVQARLFDPFFSTKPEGTGLGLPIAARIVDKQGGVLQFDTEVGRGTTFRVLLPASRDK